MNLHISNYGNSECTQNNEPSKSILVFLCLPEWGTPVPVGSPGFPGWAQHTCSCLGSLAGRDPVRNRNPVGDKRRHQAVKEATLINKCSNGSKWKVSVCLWRQDRVDITTWWFLSLLGLILARSVRACVRVCRGRDRSRPQIVSGWRWIIWVLSDVSKTPLKTTGLSRQQAAHLENAAVCAGVGKCVVTTSERCLGWRK